MKVIEKKVNFEPGHGALFVFEGTHLHLDVYPLAFTDLCSLPLEWEFVIML
jgi:hypothetical protein